MPDSQMLYLLRHAKAEPWYPGVDDFARRLSDRGIRHMRQLSKWAGDSLPEPDQALCSPSARTRETLDPFLEVWPALRAATRFEPGIYEAPASHLQALAESAFAEHDTVIMVGHNPGFEYLALSLLRDSDASRIGKMATGSLAVIEFDQGWAADAGAGILRHWVRRKDLKHG